MKFQLSTLKTKQSPREIEETKNNIDIENIDINFISSMGEGLMVANQLLEVSILMK
jgi:hypothetical protein